MAETSPSGNANVPSAHLSTWDQDLIYATLGDPIRRRLLLALARSGPQTGVELKPGLPRSIDATLKQLAVMRRSGLVVVKDNPSDRRRQLYGLAPSIPVVKTESDVVIDFGFCVIRL